MSQMPNTRLLISVAGGLGVAAAIIGAIVVSSSVGHATPDPKLAASHAARQAWTGPSDRFDALELRPWQPASSPTVRTTKIVETTEAGPRPAPATAASPAAVDLTAAAVPAPQDSATADAGKHRGDEGDHGDDAGEHSGNAGADGDDDGGEGGED